MMTVAVLAGCTTDPYETGDSELSHVTADFVEAYTDADSKIYAMLTDEGEMLRLSKPLSVTGDAMADTLLRCKTYYDRMEGEMAMVRSMSLVPTPHISEPADTLRRDPLNISAAWVATNGKYVNLTLRLKTGQSNGEAVRHAVCVVRDSIVGDMTHLTLHHDQKGAPEHYTEEVYISLRTSEIETKYVTIHTNTYETSDFTRCLTLPDGTER